MVRGNLLAEGAGAGRGAAAAQTARARRTQVEGWGQGMGGAHVEHAVHVRDAGRVEAQRLVEVRRALPSRKEGMRCGGPHATEGAWKLARGAAATQAARRRARLGGLRQGMGGAHVEHAVHARDAGRVEVHPPVERPRALSSRKEGMRCVGAKTVGLIPEARCRNGW